ncbi:hypothetical protein GUITHDRAFT_121859 [Guillardia theta CCMP2712]|uniref:Uncharacterized protein n=1 Tax=Guillardia theta (strain CCMP2712) TaxID=905079 RepID=L1I7W6_GUITC|nr:hypothetical protein GUITHDRAFT_121859 [Guillardia theta CCMP2712]EKX31955.1 hypothetical protein GUITHDRAFT_121859 [Guillardia theta CCMP2712]|eukprot:XP_005818935.1 hypothetical protein GUITHDRAFT_121859 [Guillardia theta CCMP2712]
MAQGNVKEEGAGCMIETARASSMSDQEVIVEGRDAILSELQQATDNSVKDSKVRVLARLSMETMEDDSSSLCLLVLASSKNPLSLAFSSCSVVLALADRQQLVEVGNS